MSTCRSPKKPLVAIMGSTGTGKSDLAVDLAVRYNGEIINADAMQMYKGLPVITNQITVEERRGIPHHLISTTEVDQPTWSVSMFAKEANRLIEDMHTRGKLPIIVGGTHYYIKALLFPNSLVGVEEYVPPEEIEKRFPILAGPTDVMLKELAKVDPVMASRWHPDDRRKIRRSLEIFLKTGQRASDIYDEQQKKRSEGAASENAPWEALMFWLYSLPEVLQDRLNKRVDKMERLGLMDEARRLHEHLRERTANGEVVDLSRGIFQSIGFKQLQPFLDAERASGSAKVRPSLEKIKRSNLECMKRATRRYASSQVKWLRTQTIPALIERKAMKYLYLLDSTRASDFSDNVLLPAADVTGKFLQGLEMPRPVDLSDAAKKVLSAFDEEAGAPCKPVFKARVCQVCNVTALTDVLWTRHVQGRNHRRALKNRGRRALVPVASPPVMVEKAVQVTPECFLTGTAASPALELKP